VRHREASNDLLDRSYSQTYCAAGTTFADCHRGPPLVQGETDSTLFAVTATNESRSEQPYGIGAVVYEGSQGASLVVHLPTLRDLADSTFLAAHCFTFGGDQPLEPKSKERALRLDFRPASAISTPDAEGSVFLDPQRLIVRRAVFHLTKPESLDGPIPQATATSTYRELLPFMPVVETTRTEYPIQPEGVVGARFVTYGMMVKSDRISNYQFESYAPGDQPADLAARGPTPAADSGRAPPRR
jgi:hypothetical protein